MADMDKLRADLLETIADAIADEWSARPGWHQHCAAAALSAIESAGYVLMPKDQILRKMSHEEFTEMVERIRFRENADG
jgi:hypothetical protein